MTLPPVTAYLYSHLLLLLLLLQTFKHTAFVCFTNFVLVKMVEASWKELAWIDIWQCCGVAAAASTIRAATFAVISISLAFVSSRLSLWHLVYVIFAHLKLFTRINVNTGERETDRLKCSPSSLPCRQYYITQVNVYSFMQSLLPLRRRGKESAAFQELSWLSLH